MLDHLNSTVRRFAGDRRGTIRLASPRTFLDLAMATMAIMALHLAVAYSGAAVAIVRWAHGLGLWNVQQVSLAVAVVMLAAAWYGAYRCHLAYDGWRRGRWSAAAAADAAPDAAGSEQAVSAYLATMSHGLRTPLTSIIGFADLIGNETRGPIGDDKYAEYIEQIRDDSSHMLSIVDDLLAMSRLDAAAAGREDDGEPTDVNAAVAAAVRTVVPGTTRTILQIDDALPALRVAEPDLRKMLHNVLDNAVKFSGDGGLVTVGARIDWRGELIVSVADNGIGMVGSEIAMALSRFGSVENPDAKPAAGTGLGLPLTKALTDHYGARLEIHSEIGLGTVVNMLFPADRFAAAVVAEGEAAAA